MIWVVNLGEQAYKVEEVVTSTQKRQHAPGVATDVNISPTFARMLYGVYESL